MATKSIAWNTGSGNIILTYQGHGNGSITVSSDDNNGAARSQVITVETLDGTKSVNLTVNQAACPVPVGTVLNYSYTGSYQEVELPAGQYKLQCWGSQGGSNGTNSTYGITAKEGGKGGYSEGVITLTQKTVLRIYVGGQGSSSAGGYNGGGSTTGTSQYNSGTTFGYSKMGGGGGATDIRLSDGALLSRMIVAGGGSGGAMCYKSETTTVVNWVSWGTKDLRANTYVDGYTYYGDFLNDSGLTVGKTYRVNSVTSTMPDYVIPSEAEVYLVGRNAQGGYVSEQVVAVNSEFTLSSSVAYYAIATRFPGNVWGSGIVVTIGIQEKQTSSTTVTSTESQVGGVGGGTSGGGYSSTYQGKQNAAGSGGAFGTGANQTTTGYRYCSAAGGGGWYGGGGGSYSDSSMNYCKYSGGGSGFVNTAANAQYRPSGYTGLELDSGSTYDGSQTFKAPSGSNETGHTGNGYARITRLS